jgi:hypothetical protein
LKKLKIGKSNEDGNEKLILQSEKVLIKLKITDGHAIKYTQKMT